MSKGFISSVARFFGIGERDESADAAENEEISSSETGVSKRIGNYGTNKLITKGTQKEAAEAGEKSMEALYSKLETSGRGGFHLHSGNSAFYNQVMSSMSGILNAMKQGFSTDTRGNLKQFDDMQAKYQELINACGAYLNRTTLTDKGQIRKGIVKNILETAQKDLIGLSNISMEFAYLPPEEQAGKTWAGLLDSARVTRLSVKNLFGIDRMKSGASSEVIQLIPDKVTIRRNGEKVGKLSETYYFKPEDEIDVEKKTYASKIVNNVLDRYPDLKPQEKKLLRSWAAHATNPDGKTFPDNPKGLSKQGELALETIKSKTPGVKNTYDSLLVPSEIASEGGKVNTTKRNVATSRMAALLGLEHLVAKSFTAKLYEKATKKYVYGNMMEQAEGMSPFDYKLKRIAAVKERKKREKEKDKADTTDKTDNVYDVGNIDDVVEKAPSAVSNLVQRDVLNLQVLDVLCGQMDRHTDNIMVKVEDSTITGIKGIDNDGAFGLNTDVVSNKMHEKHDRRIFDPKSGELLLPYMDKNLAQRILNLEPDMVRFSLKGLITDREIEAVVQRLDMMKQGIQHTDEKRFLDDNQWNPETAQKVFEDGWKIHNETSKEKMAKIYEEMGRIEPRLKGVKNLDNLSDEMKKRFKEVKAQAEKIVEEKKFQKRLGAENYFARMMMTTMANMAAETTPKIEIR